LGKEEEGRKFREEGLGILADRKAHAKLVEVYLQALLAETETVRLSDLAVQAGHEILTVPLDDIFVPLEMAEERRRLIVDAPVEGESEADAKRRQYPPELPYSAQEVIESHPVSVKELIETSRAVILGDPGSGKSTLLRYIARLLARAALGTAQRQEAPPLLDDVKGLVPIIVPVVRLASRLALDRRPDLESFIRDYLSNLPGVGATLIRCLEAREGFLLIDGLDEVPANLKSAVRDAIEAYLLSHREIRCLATSRIVGYESAPLGVGFARVRLQDLGDKGIKNFTQRWYETIKATSGLQEEPRVRAERLWDAISTSPGIRRIAGNPLLLTIIALIHYRGSRLPDERVEVYEAATKTLLENWVARRPFVNLRSGEILLILPRIAFEIHNDEPAGLVPYGWLRERFTTYLAEIRVTDKAELFPEVDALLETVSQHSGLLLERGWSADGHRLFGFLHLTFQEYLAALWLFEQWIAATMLVKGGPARKAKCPENPIYPVLFSPRWQEVILLAAGKASDTSQTIATMFVQGVMDFRDRYEPILKRAIPVAGRILADGVRVERGLTQRVCEELLTLWSQRWGPARIAAYDVLIRLGRSDYAPLLFSHLLARLNNRKPKNRADAAMALGEQGHSRALEPLLARLGDEHPDVRRAAAYALGALLDPRAVEPLLARLGDEHPDVRRAAAESLGRLKDPCAVEPLLARLGDEDLFVRWAAAESLGRLKDPRAVESLLARLGDEDPDVRRAAAESLGRLKDPRAVEPLLARLGDEDLFVRWAAARALGALLDPRAVEPLLPWLGDEDPGVRRAAAESLGRLKDPRAVEPLLARLGDEDPDVRRAAAHALGALLDPRAVEPLLARLGDEDPDVRRAAAESLGRLKDPRAVEPLLARLSDDDYILRQAAADALGSIGGDHVIERLEAIFFLPRSGRPRIGRKRIKGGIDLTVAREALFMAITKQQERGH
jgi:HEAT repeat protein/energy-coupling factor transporter ATP-binding protein EcfA2